MTREYFNNLCGLHYTEAEFCAVKNVLFFGEDMDSIKEEVKEKFTEPTNIPVLDATVKKLVEVANSLIEDSVTMERKSLAKAAIALIGETAFLKYKLANNLTLFQRDKERILELAGDKLVDILG